MSRWADFPKSDLLDPNMIHRVPIDSKGEVYPPHIPSANCPCRPYLNNDGTILIHNDRERGGYDA